MKTKKIFCSVLFLLFAINLQAQELNAKVTVNAERIQSSNKNVFVTLERALNQLINGTKWNDAVTFATNERIDCTFSLMILEQPSENSFKAELFVQSRRPVYNSTYTTALLNYRDNQFSFDYMENAPIQIQKNTVNSNLEAVISFYAYLILGLDFDSFSPGGGSAFFRQAQEIANQAQSSNWAGWAAFEEKSRPSIINAYTDNSLAKYHELWYIYHRKGLDEMAANPDRARMTILEALPMLKDIRQARSSEMLLQQFADAKLDEAVSIAEKATTEQKKETYDLLLNVFPSMSNQLQPLKK
ncbi:DUF4835 domain-containing protein [Bacteroidia bacterium]|nr:DUF4835 domain-containing protein [Bacteroidia bacterium]